VHGTRSSKLKRKINAALPDSQINDLKLKLHKLQTGGNSIVKTCTIRKGKELKKNTGSKSPHHVVQRLLVPSIRQQVAKPQVLIRSQQNCSKQE